MSGSDLTGRHVAITGGARGIGAATARMLARRGARISIGDLDADLAAETAAAISAAGGTAQALKLDVTDRDSFESFLAGAEAGYGPVEVLINNAGIMPTGEFLDESDAVTDRQVDINIRGVVLGCKLAGRRFVERGEGQIVNLASMAGISAFPGVAVYCATKHAVVGLGSALRQELGPHGVVVTTIAPSFVNTELIAGMTPNWLTRKLGLVEPDSVATAITRAIEHRRAGVRVVPTLGGNIVRALMPLPENVRNTLSGSLGLQGTTMHFDESVRAAYRARTESTPEQP